MKVLVLGGTGFIGRRLVDYLLKENCDITVASSGRSGNPFGDAVSTVTVDRFDLNSMLDNLSSPPYFDVVFDQVGFGPDDILNSIEVFSGRIGHYVYTSSAGVYMDRIGMRSEADFDPSSYSLLKGNIKNLGYSEGKRGAEAVLFQKAPFPVSAARFPIVLGHDDSTMRFQNHVLRVNSGDAFTIPEDCGRRNFIWVDDAGRFLSWLGLNRKTGYYNASSPRSLSARELLDMIGMAIGKEVKINVGKGSENDSTYYIPEDRMLTAEKAEKEGFRFTPIADWLPEEVKLTVEKGGATSNSADYFRNLLS